jgi:alpha/beta superfamily hydrolase
LKKHKLRIKGPAGAIETVIEEPAGEPRGLALVAHPHPLRGGSLDNKVAWTLARAALARGLIAVRPNFRGVGEERGGVRPRRR